MANPAQLIRYIAGAAICLLLVQGFGCKKEDFKVDVITMHYSGDFVNGGCGWILMKDSLNAFQAANLQDSYKVEGQKYTITYKVLEQSPDCTNSLIVKDVVYLHKVE